MHFGQHERRAFRCQVHPGSGVVGVFLFLLAAFPVTAALNATNFWPASGATNVCTDTPLRVTFDAATTLVKTSTGKVRIYSAANTLVDTIDFSNATANRSPGTVTVNGRTVNNAGVIVTSNTAAIYPHPGVLGTNQTYYVTVDSAVFSNSVSGIYPGTPSTNTWRFTTKIAGPPATNYLVVAADGSGDFCTVQGAVLSVPLGNTNRIVLFIRKGIYEELVYVTNQNNLTFRGQNAKQTIITYLNNASLNSGSTNRAVFSAQADGLAIENLTLTNRTAATGSQAETLRLDGYRCVMLNADFYSFQDTLKPSGMVYFQDCYIEGDTDFIWGQGTTYFTNCETKARNAGHNVQARNGTNNYGYVFVNCSLTKAANVSANSHNLARMADSQNPTTSNANVIYINCQMDNHITAVGWKNGSEPTGNLRLWEYKSTVPGTTNLVNVSSRASFSRQLSDAEAVLYSQPTNIFGTISNGQPVGDGWLPQLAPNVISSPTNQNINNGQTAAFSVSATGIPAPALQWRRNGTNIPNATNTHLFVSNALPMDTGFYSCVASNIAGVAASDTAVLIVNPLPAPSVGGVAFDNSHFLLSVTGVAGPTYTIQASTNLANWQDVFVTNPASGSFSWTDSLSGGASARFYRVAASPPAQ